MWNGLLGFRYQTRPPGCIFFRSRSLTSTTHHAGVRPEKSACMRWGSTFRPRAMLIGQARGITLSRAQCVTQLKFPAKRLHCDHRTAAHVFIGLMTVKSIPPTLCSHIYLAIRMHLDLSLGFLVGQSNGAPFKSLHHGR
jgi:hypothetical protein